MHTIKIQKKILSSRIQISELKKFIGKKVEITITDSINTRVNEDAHSAAGILSAYSDISRIKDEKLAWSQIAQEKHGNR